MRETPGDRREGGVFNSGRGIVNQDVEKIQVTGGKIRQQFQRIEAA